jgi:hypothetical protein
MWEAGRVVWLQDVTVGIAGVFVLPWEGPGIAGSGAVLHLAGPAVAGLLAIATAIGLSIEARGPHGTEAPLGPLPWVLFGAGLLASGLWLLFAGTLGLGTAIDTRLHLPVFAVGLHHTLEWGPWSRWFFDAAALLTIAVLAGFGPRTALARRALWIGVLAVVADSGFRALLALLSGNIPMLYRGLGAGDAVFGGGFTQLVSLPLLFVWVVLAALAVGFFVLFANLPNATGPHRSLVLLGLAFAGLGLGLQAAMLYATGLFTALGLEPVLLWQSAEYDGLLALLRFTWLLAGVATLILARWRAGEP